MSTDTIENGRVPEEGVGPFTDRIDRALTALEGNERLLWVLVGVALLADLCTTVYGLEQGLTEGNPLVRSTIADFGIGSFLAVKLAIASLGFTAWIAMAARERIVVPLGLCLPWFGAAALNLVVILG